MEKPTALQLNPSRRYALCVGIGTYSDPNIRNLSYAVNDATAIAHVLSDSARGNFEVKLLTQVEETTREILMDELDNILTDRGPDDLVVIYFSCHGEVYGATETKTFGLLPSNTVVLKKQRKVKGRSVIDVFDIAKTLSDSEVKNIVMLLDVCYSGGAGEALHLLVQKLSSDSSIFIVAATQRDQTTIESSKLQHGIFTHALLRAFQEKPSRWDGWLTITQIVSIAEDTMEPYRSFGINGPFTSAQARRSNLPIVKNPRYSQKSIDFSEQVERLLEVLRYDRVDIKIPQAPASFWVADVQAGLSELRVGVIARYNEVEDLTLEEVTRIVDFVDKQPVLDQGLLVLAKEVVSGEVKDLFDKYRLSRRMMIRTLQDIWKKLIDFKRYFTLLIEQYEKPSVRESDDSPPLAQVYVPLKTEQGDLEKAVRVWLSDSSARCAILADYGSGKSTFCQYLAAVLAKEWQEEQNDALSHTRIPLLIPLGNFGRSCNLDEYLVSHLRERQVEIRDTGALIRMAEAGLLLFLFDGFDEMASRATTDVLKKNIDRIEEWAQVKRNKVLVTTRPEYFLSSREEQDILQRYRRLDIQPLDETQIDLYLQKHISFLKEREGETTQDWQYYRQQMHKIYDLSDLVHRPVFLKMLIRTFPDLIARGRPVNRSELYHEYLQGELKRKSDLYLSLGGEKRFEIMEQIALKLYQTKSTELSSTQIEEILDDLLTREHPEDRKGLLREIATYSFLSRKDDTFHFSHESFLEYLVACRLAKDIKYKVQKHFRLNLFKKTIQEFLLEIIESESILKGETTPNSAYVKELERWFRERPQDSPTSANVFSLLARILPHERLYNLPLREANLAGVDLSEAQLQKAPLARTHLEEADLRNAHLEGADLRNAHLERADLSGAYLEGANLNKTYFTEANLVEVRLTSANLMTAFLERADLRGASLSGARLAGAILNRAHLEGANLRKAQLFGAHLEGTHLSGACLAGADLNSANLEGADLKDADLSDTDLEDANLKRANLEGTYLADQELHA